MFLFKSCRSSVSFFLPRDSGGLGNGYVLVIIRQHDGIFFSPLVICHHVPWLVFLWFQVTRFPNDQSLWKWRTTQLRFLVHFRYVLRLLPMLRNSPHDVSYWVFWRTSSVFIRQGFIFFSPLQHVFHALEGKTLLVVRLSLAFRKTKCRLYFLMLF